MKYRLFLSIAAAGVLGSTAFAGTMGSVIPSKDWTWVGSVSAGPVWARGGETQTFFWSQKLKRLMRPENPLMFWLLESCLLVYKKHGHPNGWVNWDWQPPLLAMPNFRV